MREFDLTLAMTAHAETVMAGPTVASAEAAISLIEDAGYRVQKMIGFDSPSDACRAYFQRPQFEAWDKAEFQFRDQGKTRNALAEVAKGRWLAFLDSDDLFSENWLLEAVRLLEQPAYARAIVHPELNWVFDAGHFVFTKPAQTDPLFTPYYFLIANYYDALCVAPREAYLEHPYADRAVKDGFAYEDWQWAVESMAGGWDHVAAQDTIIFKRRRDASQNLESRHNRVMIRHLNELAVDRAGSLGHAPVASASSENQTDRQSRHAGI